MIAFAVTLPKKRRRRATGWGRRFITTRPDARLSTLRTINMPKVAALNARHAFFIANKPADDELDVTSVAH